MRKSYEDMVKSIIFYRTLTVILGMLIAMLIFTVNIEEEKITELEYNISKCSGYSDSEHRFKNTMQVLHIQNDRVRELEGANGALMFQLDKCNGINDAIKNTPLPKMKRV